MNECADLYTNRQGLAGFVSYYEYVRVRIMYIMLNSVNIREYRDSPVSGIEAPIGMHIP